MPITKSDLETATRVGNAKQSFSARTGLRDYGVAMSAARGQANNTVGSLGELKTSQFFGVEFDDSEDGRHKVDCELFEARTRDIDNNGRDLAIRPHDKMRLPHVLVWIERKRLIATLVGWLVGWEGHARAMQAKADAGYDVWWQQSKGCWFVPPPYTEPALYNRRALPAAPTAKEREHVSKVDSGAMPGTSLDG